MKRERITPAQLLNELRITALLEAKATDEPAARAVWRDVFNWAGAIAGRNRITIHFQPGAAVPGTAKRRREAAGSTRKGERRRDGAPGTTADRLAELDAKIKDGTGLTMAERGERQGLIFNHTGKTRRPTNLERRNNRNH